MAKAYTSAEKAPGRPWSRSGGCQRIEPCNPCEMATSDLSWLSPKSQMTASPASETRTLAA
jgi:hypothetical protein